MTVAVKLQQVGFQRGRKSDSRESLLVAATSAFCSSGYFAVSVEDIAAAAGVSRMTFYRHFRDKAAIASELFRENAEAALPRMVAIAARDFCSLEVVTHWVASLFAADRASRQLLRAFIQANVDDGDFTENAHGFISDIIGGLGRTIPAFAADSATPSGRKQWLEAWLLIYEILDQSNHAARGAGIAADPLIIDILSERFLGFVSREHG
jgi:AcrR family transcriptional regulator